MNLQEKSLIHEIESLPNPGVALRPSINAIGFYIPTAEFYTNNGKRKPTSHADALNNMFIFTQIMDGIKYGEIPENVDSWNLLNSIEDFLSSFLPLAFLKKFMYHAICFGFVILFIWLGGWDLLKELFTSGKNLCACTSKMSWKRFAPKHIKLKLRGKKRRSSTNLPPPDFGQVFHPHQDLHPLPSAPMY